MTIMKPMMKSIIIFTEKEEVYRQLLILAQVVHKVKVLWIIQWIWPPFIPEKKAEAGVELGISNTKKITNTK